MWIEKNISSKREQHQSTNKANKSICKYYFVYISCSSSSSQFSPISTSVCLSSILSVGWLNRGKIWLIGGKTQKRDRVCCIFTPPWQLGQRVHWLRGHVTKMVSNIGSCTSAGRNWATQCWVAECATWLQHSIVRMAFPVCSWSRYTIPPQC